MTPAARHLAIVTGASRGLGRLITIELAGAGVDVLMVGRDERALAQTAEAASETAASLHPFVCDLSRPEAAELVVLAARQLGAVDILVNNAAIQGPIGPMWEIDFAAFETTMLPRPRWCVSQRRSPSKQLTRACASTASRLAHLLQK